MSDGASASQFETLQSQPADALLGLIDAFRADPRPDKIDLGVGVYRDDAGATPVMHAVKAAETELLRDQASKSYLGPEGDARFVALLEPLVFGDAGTGLTGIQTPGGTGALRLGAELLQRARPGARVWLGLPTWPNHASIFEAAGLQVVTHPYYDAASRGIDFAGMMAALLTGRAGDIVLLHGSSHNPTGTDLATAQWSDIIDLIADRRMIPFVDFAYHGLGYGLDADAAGLRLCLERIPEVLVAYSCDKNFGLYRERVGALWARGSEAGVTRRLRENQLALARVSWSMPPDHGAAIVRTILESPELTADWRAELEAMRVRLASLRASLASTDPRLDYIARGSGMFAMLPINVAAVARLRADHGVYMVGSGRINIAGLHYDTVGRFAAALAPLL
jgi:aromatic-amino-acid transaminase